MSDGKDAAVHRMQATAVEAVADRPAAQPEPCQLAAGNDAVLLAGQRRDRDVVVTLARFGLHMKPNCARVGHG